MHVHMVKVVVTVKGWVLSTVSWKDSGKDHQHEWKEYHFLYHYIPTKETWVEADVSITDMHMTKYTHYKFVIYLHDQTEQVVITKRENFTVF